MQPARADANFCAESISIAICKASGRIVKNARGIDPWQERARSVGIVRDDRIRVGGAEALDVVDSFVNAGHNPQCEDQIAILSVPLVFSYWFDGNVRNCAYHFGGPAQANAFFLHPSSEERQK